MLMILIAIIISLLIFTNYFNIVSILNSHFGTNLSTQESDNKHKNFKNLISKLYDDKIERFYTNSPFKTYIPSNAVRSIDISDLTKDKFVLLTNNFTTPLVVKGFLKDSRAVNEWNLDFFADNYGETELPTVLNADIAIHKTYISNKTSEKYEYVTIKKFV